MRGYVRLMARWMYVSLIYGLPVCGALALIGSALGSPEPEWFSSWSMVLAFVVGYLSPLRHYDWVVRGTPLD